MTLLYSKQQGTKEIKKSKRGEKAKKKRRERKSHTHREIRKKDEVAAARERERERETIRGEFPTAQFYYEKLSDKENATDYTRVLVHIIY